jgi:potassium/hydrogen antiporter
MIQFSPENIILIGSLLIFTAILISRAGFRFGIPVLLLFIVVGMAFGVDGLGLAFDNFHIAQFIGTIALCVILYCGGLETKFDTIKPVLKEGIVLSTAGVFLTALFTGSFIYLLTRVGHLSEGMSIVMCFLLAAVMSSTDSASVFNILRNANMRLKENLQPVLELESGSNDPMAYVITVVLIQCAQQLFEPGSGISIDYTRMIGNALLTFTMQLGIGAIMGIGLGRTFSWIMGKLKLNGASLYAILVLSIGFFIYSITGLVKGNGFLAIYLAGVIIGNKPMAHKKEVFRFTDTVTWLMQMGMFLSLGLLVNPKEMISVAPVALLIGIFLTFVGRPLAVFISLLPFRKLSFKAKTFISWVGLKGATPIIFAIFTVVADIPGSEQIFNIVFFITMVSMLIQGMSIPAVARNLNLALPQEKAPETFGIEIPEEAGKLIDHILTESDLSDGDTLKEVTLPEGARVVMIKREGELIVPDGSVKLKAGDKLLMIMGNQEVF